MSNDNDDRLARLRERAKDMGLQTLIATNYKARVSKGVELLMIDTDDATLICKRGSLITAHALLTGLSLARGPVVVIKSTEIKYRDGSKVLSCIPSCALDNNCPFALNDEEPGPDCPGPAPDDMEWRLGLVPKEVDDASINS